MDDVNGVDEIEQVVRTRLRSLRTTLGLSLDELAARTNLSPSTISRVETGKRTISLDVLAAAWPPPSRSTSTRCSTCAATTTWSSVRRRAVGRAHDLDAEPADRQHDRRSRCGSSRPDAPPSQRVHPGHDWFFVFEGRVRLSLGEREIIVETGEAAEFATMTPHAIAAIDGPAELIMIFDRDGQRAHVHQRASRTRPATRDPRPQDTAQVLWVGQTVTFSGDRVIEISAFWDAAEQPRQLGLA